MGGKKRKRLSKKAKKKKKAKHNHVVLKETTKWQTLSHNGVLFPAEYQPHGKPVFIDGVKIDNLNPLEEEYITYYTALVDTEHGKNPVFRNNFFKDWTTKVLTREHKKQIKSLESLDLSRIKEHLEEQRVLKKLKTPEEKEEIKAKKAEIEKQYGWATIDGKPEKLANFMVEPPGLFLGRGDHPSTGMIKWRMGPKDITLNLGEEAPVPKASGGQSWGGVVHQHDGSWVAWFPNQITNSKKYVWLNAGSSLKTKSDQKKFDVAKRLVFHIDEIRKRYTKELKSRNLTTRQIATIVALVDKTSIRAGNEKDETKSAKTYGICSLLVQHVILTPPCGLEFDFLAKDSMRYYLKTTVDSLVFINLLKFQKGKGPGKPLFDQVNTSMVNTYLKRQMPGLTLKTFRTYNASVLLEKELEKTPTKVEDSTTEKLANFNKANRQVAVLCNHQKAAPKKHGEAMEKMDDKLEGLKKQKVDLENLISKIDADELCEDDEYGFVKDAEGQTVVKKLCTDPDKLANKLVRIEKQIKENKLKRGEKDLNSVVSLGTSRINYIDPRVSVSWSKRVDCPIEKLFSKTLVKKFEWALSVPPTYKF